MDPRLPILSLLALTLVLGVGGCTATVSGSAVRQGAAPNNIPTVAGGPNIAELDPGNYPTRPQPPYGPANSATVGVTMEAHRMAANVVVPNEVDPTLTRPSWFNTSTLGTSELISVDIPPPGPDIAAAHHVLLGFSSSRTSQGPVDRKVLINAVLRFPDPADASDAATELAAKTPSPTPARAIPIPYFPTALAAAYDDEDFHAVASFLAHGPYLLYQYAEAPGGVGAAADLVAATLNLQIPRIDAFVPTAPAHFRDLPIDPTGFLNRVVPPGTGTQDSANFGEYQPQGALHFEADPRAASLYAAAGVDTVAILGTTVYRARDAAGAQQMVEMSAADAAAEPGATPAISLPGLPSAKCFDVGQNTRPRFQCFGRADRYAFKAASADARDAQQQMASQYLMLTS